MDYTLERYSKLCETVASSKYKSVTVMQFIELQDVDLHDSLIILRHDVDRFPEHALALAEIEQEYGLTASYYFRIPASWDEGVIVEIIGMGHEVGLHYECLDKAHGDIEKVPDILISDLLQVNRLTPITTVSMHGNPSTKYDNRDIWKHYDFNDFQIKGEVYLSIDFEKVLYYSDTGRTWLDGKFNIKDFIPIGMKSVVNKPQFSTTDHLIQLVQKEDRNIYLLTHPERWQESKIEWLLSLIMDTIVNYLKLLYKFICHLRDK